MLSWNQIVLFMAPWLLLATTYLVYQLLERRYGKKKSYLGGFLFYWIVWCILFPLALTIAFGTSFGAPLPWWPSSLFSQRPCGRQAPGWCWFQRCWP
jgi:hypothetical protein